MNIKLTAEQIKYIATWIDDEETRGAGIITVSDMEDAITEAVAAWNCGAR